MWTSIVKLFSTNQGPNTMVRVFKHAFKSMSKIMIIWVGVSVAFVFSGYLLFPTSSYFNTLNKSFISLFALMVGDSLLMLHGNLASHGFVSFIFISRLTSTLDSVFYNRAAVDLYNHCHGFVLRGHRE